MKHDRSLFTLLIAITFLSLSGANAILAVSAQQKQPAQPQCPVTKVSSPESVYAKDTLKFTAQVRGGDPKVTPTYNWTVSAGSIAAGQGTATIEVDTSEAEPDSAITATVELGGFDRECRYGSSAASGTTAIIKKAEARKLDEYGKVTPKEQNTKLEHFTIGLFSDPSAMGYIIAYNGRASLATDAQKAANGAKNYLVKTLGLTPERVVTVDGGYREQPTIELWLVPSGAEPPKPTPTIKTGVSKPAPPAKSTKP